MYKYKRLFAFVPMTLCLISSGCMLTPNEGEVISNRNQPVYFGIATGTPNEVVEIQAKNPSSGEWEAIGQMTTFPIPVDANGLQWYLATTEIPVPHAFWQQMNAGNSVFYSAEVRTIGESGNAMAGFQVGTRDWILQNIGPETFEGSFADFLDRVTGDSVQIVTEIE